MACPHSNAPGSSPLVCSQCLQATTAFAITKVTVEDGVLMQNGKPSGLLSEVNKQRYAKETADIGPPNRTKKCSHCGQVGHNARTCGNPRKEVVGDEPELN